MAACGRDATPYPGVAALRSVCRAFNRRGSGKEFGVADTSVSPPTFKPLLMGLRRGLEAQPDRVDANLDIILDIDFDAGWLDQPPACGEIGAYATSYDVRTTGFDAQCDSDASSDIQQLCR